MALNERQKHSAELYAGGKNITQIANECNVSRQTIYDDEKNEEWRAEVDRLLTDARTCVDRKIAGQLNDYLRAASDLALNGRSEKVRSDMLQYLINRVCGSPAAKQADAIDNDDNGKDVQTPQQLQDELARFRKAKQAANDS